MSKGVPTGGQFSPQSHSEPDTALSTAADDADEPSITQIMDWSHRIASRIGALPGAVGTDDLESEIYAAYYASDRSGVEDPRAYLRQLAHNIRAKTLNQGRAHDAVAAAEYVRRADAFEREHGRRPSHRESDEIAAEIRMSYQPSRRPSLGFHHASDTRKTVSIDSLRETGWEPPAIGDPTADNHELSPSLQRVADLVDPAAGAPTNAAGTITKAARNAGARELYDGLAETYGAPLVKQGGMDPRKGPRSAPEARRQIGGIGGAARAAEMYLQGALDDDHAKWLFGPYDIRDGHVAEDRRRVAELLDQYSTYADEMWDASCSKSTQVAAKNAGRVLVRDQELSNA